MEPSPSPATEPDAAPHTAAQAEPQTAAQAEPQDRDDGAAAWVVPVLLLTLTVGIVRQGGTSPEGPAVLGIGLLVTSTLAAVGHGLRAPARRLGSVTVAPLLLLGAWALLDGALHGSAVSGTAMAAEAVGVAAVLVVVPGLGPPDRAMLRDGLVLVGALVGAMTWLGVVGRFSGWAATGRGLWRADGPLTYANATAAVLVMLALVAVGGALDRSRSGLVPEWGYLPAAALMLGAAAATLSRGGALALVAGCLVLVALAGRTALRPLLAAGVGGALILVGLVPSMPVAVAAQPVWAVAGMAAGLALAVGLDRGSAWVAAHARPAAVVGVLTTVALVAVTALTASGALSALARGRITLDTTHRGSAAAAAWQALDGHLPTGLGPGASSVHWRDATGASMTLAYLHDEYLQVLLELGAVGAVLLVGWLVGCVLTVARRLRRADPDGRRTAAALVAGSTAFAVHGGVDFVWHLPALALTAATLLGLAQPEPCARGCGS